MTLDIIEEALYSRWLQDKVRLTKKNCKTLTGGVSYTSMVRLGFSIRKFEQKFGIGSYYSKSRFCECCGSYLTKKSQLRFCSHSCSAKATNPVRTTRRKKSYKRVPRRLLGAYRKIRNIGCRQCFSTLNTKSPGRFCCVQCSTNNNKELQLEDWKAGRLLPKNRNAYTLLCYEYGNRCSRCGITDWCGQRIRLEVEHIDGNSNNFAHGNYCLLCPNCHSQTPTYKGKNKGNGRYCRSQRYRDGKSY